VGRGEVRDGGQVDRLHGRLNLEELLLRFQQVPGHGREVRHRRRLRENGRGRRGDRRPRNRPRARPEPRPRPQATTTTTASGRIGSASAS
jgi:hypothetical protein